MTLGAHLLTFTPAVLIKSADVNSNFVSLSNVTAFSGGLSLPMNMESGNVQSDGNGNLRLAVAQIGMTTAGDIMDASSATDIYLKASSATGTIAFYQDGTLLLAMTRTGLTLYQGGLIFTPIRESLMLESSTATTGVALTVTKNAQGQVTGVTAKTKTTTARTVTIQQSQDIGASLSRTSLFTGTGTGTYNHGNGGKPDICFPLCTKTGSYSGNNFDSFTSTTVHIFCEFAYTFSCYVLGF
jgi:hypothetical protein